MCREQMMQYIQDTLEEADDALLEQFYWFLIFETAA